jgi:hypothetical protein
MPACRILALLSRLPFIHRRFAGSWLFGDRDFKADDNAEHLYRWTMRNRPEKNIFFALRKDSPDWARLKQEGFRLIGLGSLRYAFAWLHCAWLISSNRSGYITKPGWREWKAAAAWMLCTGNVRRLFSPSATKTIAAGCTRPCAGTVSWTPRKQAHKNTVQCLPGNGMASIIFCYHTY